MCDLQVCCWPAAVASPSPPIRSVCSPHTLAEGIFSAGPLCAVGQKVNIIIYCVIVLALIISSDLLWSLYIHIYLSYNTKQLLHKPSLQYYI